MHKIEVSFRLGCNVTHRVVQEVEIYSTLIIFFKKFDKFSDELGKKGSQHFLYYVIFEPAHKRM